MICGMCERPFESEELLYQHLEVCVENKSVSGARDSQAIRAIAEHRVAQDMIRIIGWKEYLQHYGRR